MTLARKREAAENIRVERENSLWREEREKGSRTEFRIYALIKWSTLNFFISRRQRPELSPEPWRVQVRGNSPREGRRGK